MEFSLSAQFLLVYGSFYQILSRFILNQALKCHLSELWIGRIAMFAAGLSGRGKEIVISHFTA